MITIVLLILAVWIVSEWCLSFRDLLGERGWINETTRSQKQKQCAQIAEASKMMY